MNTEQDRHADTVSMEKPTCPVCGSDRIRRNRVGITTEGWPYQHPEFWIEGTFECLDCTCPKRRYCYSDPSVSRTLGAGTMEP